MKKKTNYQVTIGYKAVICVNVQADNESEANKKALETFDKQQAKMNGKSVEIQDSTYKVDGVLDMDATWNMVQLGETLQTEQTEPEPFGEQHLLDKVKYEIALQEYSKFWFELTDSQAANIVDKVAIRYAELVNKQKQ